MTSSDFLSNVSIFSDIEPSALEFLAAKFRRRMFKKGQVIFHEADTGGTLFVVESGSVRISVTAQDGRESDIALLGEGDCFGEMSVLDGGLRSATATSVGETRARSLAREDFLIFLDRHPAISIRIISVLTKRIRLLDEKVGDILFLDVPSRVAKKLIELANTEAASTGQKEEIVVLASQEELSRMIGASRESVARTLSNYKNMGYIAPSRRQIRITDLSGLKRMATF